ncbi:MAG TPA: LysR substrate-binding domain-containing protein [Phenylobacterium sp.]|nr:LysR substrate-binding domain-containing protein [Phenylobacterium sp.]
MTSTPRRAVPPLSALLAFERAAAQLSFKRAAADLALSPSAISHQIRGLEDRLGVQLFTRGTGAIRLTAAGKNYFDAVNGSLKRIEHATRALLEDRRDTQATLRVSALPFFASAVMLPAYADLQADGVLGKMRLETSHEYADFESTDIDVAIRLGRDHSAGLKLFPLLEIRGLPVCAPEIRRALTCPRDLAGQTLIHIDRQPHAWSHWLAEVGEPGLTAARDLWVDSVPAALEAAEHGLGVALGMDPLIYGRKDFGRALVAPFAIRTDRSQVFYMVCRPERFEDKPIAAFRNWLVRAVERQTEPPAEDRVARRA